jgi:hypothetical protein
MAGCRPLGNATATVAEVENIDEAAVATELERAFGENPTARLQPSRDVILWSMTTQP